MTTRFSPSTGTFYPPDMDYGDQLPADLVTVPLSDFEAAMRRPPGAVLTLSNGRVVHTAPPALTLDQLRVVMVGIVQSHMDDAAKARGYDSVLAAISYAEEPASPIFQAEGLAFRAWRSRVWTQCHELMASVSSGAMAVPTPAELLALMPALVLDGAA